MKKVLFILGTTCSGKSTLAIELARSFNGEIISADSVQIYKEFDIGSAKIEKEEMTVEHYGIDIKEPTESFSAYDFIEFTKEKIEYISNKGKLPIIVGGTGLYAKALIEGYNFGDTDRHEQFRKEIEEKIKGEGIEKVYDEFNRLFPQLAKDIDKNNPVRLIRAFEIAYFGGQKSLNKQPKYDFLALSLTMDRQMLYNKINSRVDEMVRQGLFDEVKYLYNKYGQFVQPMKAIGYKEVVSFLKGEISKEDTISLIKQHTRNYAKRQITFLKGISGLVYIDNIDKNKALIEAKREVGKWLKQSKN